MRQSIAAYFRLLWENHPWRGLISLLHTVANVLLTVFVPYFISLALAAIVIGDMQSFWINIQWLILVAIAAVFGNGVGFTVAIRLAARLERLAANKAFEHLLHRSVGFHADNPSGKLVANATEYGRNCSRVLFDFIFNGLLPYISSGVIGITIVFFQSVEIGLALLAIYLLMITMTVVDSRLRTKYRVTYKVIQDRTVANMADVIINAQATKTFARESEEKKFNDTKQRQLMHYRMLSWTMAALSGTLRLLILLVAQIGFIIYVALEVQSNPAYLGIGIYVFTYTIGMLTKLFELSVLLRTGEDALLNASTMTQILTEDSEIVDTEDATELSVKHGLIEFKNVHFSYPDDKNKPVFSKFNLTIPNGQKVGLVGRSGGGKSTLTRLILRFEDVGSGSITIDDQDIRHVTQHSLREAVGYVPQEPLLFHRTISENVAYGKPDATSEEIIYALKRAHAYDFVHKLPNGVDTIVGERGVKLSGGQRQRIAIARAILKNAPILVLDEATSALDSESEQYIQKALTELMRGRTSIVIAHRLSTIAKLDRIIVLDEGKIVEDGSHSELVAKDGVYSQLWKHQSGGFIEE